jgi:hypothetical protein
MKPDIIKDEILDVLESLKEQIPVLIDYTDKIPQIELDIVLENIRKLYEDINDLKRCETIVEEIHENENVTETLHEEINDTGKNEKLPDALSAEGVEVADANKDITEKIEDEEHKEEINEESETENTTIETVLQKTETDVTPVSSKPPQTENVDTEKPVREPVKIIFETQEEEIITPKKRKIKDKSEADLFSSSEPTVADKYKDQTTSLNETIVDNKEDKSIAAKMQKEKIDDLKIAIGLNEKFLFINELFGGDMQTYSDAIDKINTQSTYDDTIKLLDELNLKFQWNKETDTYKKLISLVERKYKNA